MSRYYHFTGYENLESICEFGLVPKIGGRTRSIGDKRNAVFLSEGKINTILMYSSLLYYFETHSGEKGLSAIEFYENRINNYLEEAKLIPLDEEGKKEIEATKEVIKFIEEMMEYSSFNDYIGAGVYLGVSGVRNINNENPKDSYSLNTIKPKNIKVVCLRNRTTGEIIDDRESVLTYFMSTTSPLKVIENIYNVITIKTIKELYLDRKEELADINKKNYEIIEVPIKSYLDIKKQNKIR